MKAIKSLALFVVMVLNVFFLFAILMGIFSLLTQYLHLRSSSSGGNFTLAIFELYGPAFILLWLSTIRWYRVYAAQAPTSHYHRFIGTLNKVNKLIGILSLITLTVCVLAGLLWPVVSTAQTDFAN